MAIVKPLSEFFDIAAFVRFFWWSCRVHKCYSKLLVRKFVLRTQMEIFQRNCALEMNCTEAHLDMTNNL